MQKFPAPPAPVHSVTAVIVSRHFSVRRGAGLAAITLSERAPADLPDLPDLLVREQDMIVNATDLKQQGHRRKA